MSVEPFSRYLRLLGVPAHPPSLPALGELVAAHLCAVPFENLSKLHFRADPEMRLPPMPRFLDGIEHHHFGGTCYANNWHFVRLLAHLGYDARLCGADMRQPDVHVVGIVRLEGHEYLVDVGYGAPLLAPLPLDRPEDQAVERGSDRYVLHPRDADGRSRLDLVRDGVVRHGYRVNPAARDIGEFARVIEESFAPAATFMNAFVIVRAYRNESVVLSNQKLILAGESTFRVEEIPSVSALPTVVEEHFGIPAAITRGVLEGLELTVDAWGYADVLGQGAGRGRP